MTTNVQQLTKKSWRMWSAHWGGTTKSTALQQQSGKRSQGCTQQQDLIWASCNKKYGQLPQKLCLAGRNFIQMQAPDTPVLKLWWASSSAYFTMGHYGQIQMVFVGLFVAQDFPWAPHSAWQPFENWVSGSKHFYVLSGISKYLLLGLDCPPSRWKWQMPDTLSIIKELKGYSFHCLNA